MSNTQKPVDKLLNGLLNDLGIAFTNVATQRLEEAGVEEISSSCFSLKTDKIAHYLFELAKPEMDKCSNSGAKCFWGIFANLKTNELVAKPTLVISLHPEEKNSLKLLESNLVI